MRSSTRLHASGRGVNSVDAGSTGMISVLHAACERLHHATQKYETFKTWTVYFWNFPSNIFRLQLTMGNWNYGKWNCSCVETTVVLTSLLKKEKCFVLFFLKMHNQACTSPHSLCSKWTASFWLKLSGGSSSTELPAEGKNGWINAGLKTLKFLKRQKTFKN